MTHTAQQLAADIGFCLPDTYNAARLLWDNLDRNPDAPAVYTGTQTHSYAQLIDEAARIGSHLRGLGLSPGDRVLLFLDDVPCYPAAIMGTMRAGLVPMLINTLSTPDLVAFYLNDSDAKAVILGREFADLFATATPLIIAEDRPWAQAATDLPEHPTARTDPAFWMYSSGSTGRPKGIVHLHQDAAFTAHSYSRDILGLGPDDICFSIPKIFFAYGFGNSVTFPFSVGAASVLLAGRPTPDRCYGLIAATKPTVLFGLPTLYTALVQAPEAALADLSSVRLCVSAAEVLSREIATAWRDHFGHAIIEGLGSTEVLHIYLSNDQSLQKHGSAGRVVAGYAARLIDEHGNDVGDDTEGVMEVLGLSNAPYYWNRPDKTAETMRDGWIYTGDRFVRDADGYFFFRGRADDLVKVSGQWVYPLEVEHVLNEHPDVREACVLAVEGADKRTRLIAWIAVKTGIPPDASLTKALQDFAKSHLLPHKYPRDIKYLDVLPKTGTDKIDRQALRQSHKD